MKNKDRIETTNVPNKLRKKIQKFVKKVDNKSCNPEQKGIYTKALELNDRNKATMQQDIFTKRPVGENLPPFVKFIHQNSDLYYKYQDLCLYYEEARNKVQLKHLRKFIDVKNPSKIEQNIGIVLTYLASFLDVNIMLYSTNTSSNPKEMRLANKSWK